MHELAKQTRDPKVLRDQLLNILVAGRDTTAGLLSFVFLNWPETQKYAKLKEEIYNKFGSGEDARIDEITFESLKQCEYLKAVINESLRLYPSVPHNFRTATRNTTLPRGGGPDGMSPIVVKKGQHSFGNTQRSKLMELTLTNLDQKDGLNQKLENWDGLMSHSTVVQEFV